MAELLSYKVEFIQFALREGLLKLGSFKLKSGRISPYFIDLGSVCHGSSLDLLGEFYLKALKSSTFWPEFAKKDLSPVLYGPPYKGILLAGVLAMKVDQELAAAGGEASKPATPFSYSRKEAKDHGEGGVFVGYPFQRQPSSRPMILVDDVLTAGTAVRANLSLLESHGKSRSVMGLLLAIDREEKSSAEPSLSAADELKRSYQWREVVSIIRLQDLVAYLRALQDGSRTAESEEEQRVLDWLVHEQGLAKIEEYRLENGPRQQ